MIFFAFVLSLLLILSTVGNSLCSIATGRDISVGLWKVTRIHDGDTFWADNGEGEKKIRISRVDAPESTQPWGPEATKALAEMILGKDVALSCMGESYGRKVCAVSLDGEDVGRRLVRNGHAIYDPRYSKKADLEDEKEAKEKKLGLWGLPKKDRTPPWKYRHKKKKKPVIKKMAGFFNKRKRN